MIYTFNKTTIHELQKTLNLEEVITPLLTDSISFEEVLNELSSIQLISVTAEKDNPLGFFLYEPMGDSVETHAFIPVCNRNRSMAILRAFRGYLTGVCGFNRIYTTVTGDFSYIVRALGMIGFKQFFKEGGIVPKNGTLYDLYHLEYIKE
ncbi:hypothetical protein LAh9_142 [Aeromonas phage LAh_9]|uniref:Uncharacterized protein n=2 Tax=Lahexavirus TaxID=2843411 RepID=A0A514A0X5_9CAUD|nr:hypothetical protein HWC30_gp020 [Aeromonas phage LAh_6]YP_009847624.1 hypothetical protein HWC32_gp143 [Aeromonas phage LAh_9]QDH46544.1 hypothetical protein LAh6_20 [Aeromonas phage LAh_6]QDH46923.1 hypothetical protein LAh9_142 [Aeromonas phage LAh_9]